MKTIVITSWYFNPIHPGHIECLKKCKALWDELWVIVNNDIQARLKTGKQELFQDEKFRCDVVSAIRYVDEVRLSIDCEPTIFETLKLVAREIRQKHGPDTKLIFGKWWDWNMGNILEKDLCKELHITVVDGLWKKIYNSSDYRNKVI